MSDFNCMLGVIPHFRIDVTCEFTIEERTNIADWNANRSRWFLCASKVASWNFLQLTDRLEIMEIRVCGKRSKLGSYIYVRLLVGKA